MTTYLVTNVRVPGRRCLGQSVTSPRHTAAVGLDCPAAPANDILCSSMAEAHGEDAA